MSIRNRAFFFDPGNLTGFKDKDIPTEDSMRDFLDSVAFFKEINSEAQLTKAGLVKTVENSKVNNRDSSDTAGISPIGWTTAVQPHQIFKVLSTDGSVTITQVTRGGGGIDDDVLDYNLSINFPPDPAVPTTTDDLDINDQKEVFGYNESESNVSICDPSFGSSQNSIPSGTLTELLDLMLEGQEEIAKALDKVSEAVCSTQVALGDVLITVTPPVNWTDSFAEPRGQLLNVADYPELYAIFGNEYGGSAPTTFALPDLVNNKYLRAKVTTAGLVNSTGGSNNYTLTAVNIPEHTHTFSGNTDTDGAHTHPIPTRNSNGSADGCRNSDPADDSFNLSNSGAHNHSFNGTTNAYGQNPPNPVVTEPEYNHVYLKMRIK